MAEEKKPEGEIGESELVNKEIETGASGRADMERKSSEEQFEFISERKEGAAEKDDSYAKILAKVKTGQQSDDKSIPDDAKAVSVAETAESKINGLVNLAMQKGVVHAVKVARHMEDNYMLDEMHDRLLADDLHEALVKKGLLKEI